MFKILVIALLSIAFFLTPAFAGNRPEFDSVGYDSQNFFSDAVMDIVVANNSWNNDSDFAWNDAYGYGEKFVPPTQETEDICFPGYLSAFTPVRTTVAYTWYIVLQMDLRSDLNIKIRDCVLQEGSQTAFGSNPLEGASQTGRYTLPDGTPVFNPGANPQVTVTAYPGPYHVLGFDAPFVLTNRTQGGLYLVPFETLPYTSKALWQEDLIAVMPEYGIWGYPLTAGDMIKVEVVIPPISPVDISYGADSIYLSYIGSNGTQVVAGSPLPTSKKKKKK